MAVGKRISDLDAGDSTLGALGLREIELGGQGLGAWRLALAALRKAFFKGDAALGFETETLEANATSASVLAPGRSINGVQFDGSQDIAIQLDADPVPSAIRRAKQFVLEQFAPLPRTQVFTEGYAIALDAEMDDSVALVTGSITAPGQNFTGLRIDVYVLGQSAVFSRSETITGASFALAKDQSEQANGRWARWELALVRESDSAILAKATMTTLLPRAFRYYPGGSPVSAVTFRPDGSGGFLIDGMVPSVGTDGTHQVRADLDGIVQAYIDVVSSGWVSFAASVGDLSRWRFTLVELASGDFSYPAWSKELSDAALRSESYGTSTETEAFLFGAAIICDMYASVGDWDAMMRGAYGLARAAVSANSALAAPFAADQRLDDLFLAQGQYFVGAMCEVVYACIKALLLFPSALENSSYWVSRWTRWVVGVIQPAIPQMLAWLNDRRDATTKLARGGIIGGTPLPWYATEHNLRLWFVFSAAATLDSAATLGGKTYQQIADEIKSALVTYLWNSGENRFNQGMATDTTPDTTDALDGNTLGAIFLKNTGQDFKAGNATDYYGQYFLVDFPEWAGVANAKGYNVFNSRSYFGAGSVWFPEGTTVAHIARRRINGVLAPLTMEHLAALQRSDGSFTNFHLDDVASGNLMLHDAGAAAFYVMVDSADATWYTEVG